jgi:hypothetical protein
MKRFADSFALVPVCIGCFLLLPSAAFAAERIEVPIKQTVLTNGNIRYSVPVVIGTSSAIDAMLDTGSTGLRILQAAVPASAYAVTDRPSAYGYGSGVNLRGVIANASVAVGGAATGAPIPVEIVRSVGCLNDNPNCPASRMPAEDYRIGGSGLAKQGFMAIIGVNMGSADVVNPLNQIGAHSWIIILPKPGDHAAGKLIINPEVSDRSGYALFHTDEILRRLPGAGGFHDAISGCLVSDETHKRICGPTLLDTGAPGVEITSGDSSALSGWKAGARMVMEFKNDNGAEPSNNFVANAGQPSRISSALRPNQPRTRISAGMLPYFSYSVLYDNNDDVIGLRAR